MSLFFGRGEQRSAQWFATDVTPSGAITTERAQHLSPVFAAIRHLVDFVSLLPVDCYRLNPDGSRTDVVLPQLLRGQNDIGRPGLDQWLGQAMYGILTTGNAVGWVVSSNGYGLPDNVRWVRPEFWSYSLFAHQWYIYGEPVPASRVVHIPWIVPSGHVLGLSPIEHFASLIRAGLNAQDYADIGRGGGLPPAHIKNNRKELNPDQAREHKRRAVASWAKGEPWVTGADWDLNVVTIPPSHAQFIETLKMTATQVADIYGIDPREVGGEPAGTLTYQNEESRDLNRANNARPYIVRLENAISRLLPQNQVIKLNADATIRTDIKTRVDVIGAQIKDGRLSVNEARALEDRPPVTGGDFHNVPAPGGPTPPSNREATP